MKIMKKLKSGDGLFYICITVILTIVFLLVLYPCIFVLSASFSSGDAVQAGKVYLWPVNPSLAGYKAVFGNKDIWSGFFNSLFYTVVGTTINLIITMLCAYPMSRKDLRGRSGFMLYFAFTMFFGGGLIPTYLTIQQLGLLNTRWVRLLPGALSVYNMIVARSFIQANIPEELLQASQIDGCSDAKYLTHVVLPLSKSVMAVLVLFYAVGHWNQYFSAMIYLHDPDLYPLTIFLREILLMDKIDPSTITDPEAQEKLAQYAGVLKYALIVVSMIPILMIYPFIQKYFVKGVMIGSVKG